MRPGFRKKGSDAIKTKGLLPSVLLLLIGAFYVASASSEFSTHPLSREYQLKAAFLFNFSKFVSWPSEVETVEDASINFCVMGATPLDRALEKFIVGKKVHGREPTMRSIADIDQLRHCHVLFIARSERPAVPGLIDLLRDSSVLTVGETPNFSSNGGIIEFIVVGNKVRFAINNEAAKRAQLVLSSELLKLARIVRESRQE